MDGFVANNGVCDIDFLGLLTDEECNILAEAAKDGAATACENAGPKAKICSYETVSYTQDGKGRKFGYTKSPAAPIAVDCEEDCPEFWPQIIDH